MQERKRRDILGTIHDVGTTLDDALNIKEALDYDIAAKRAEVEKLQEMKSGLELEVKEQRRVEEISSQLLVKDREIFFLKEKAKDSEAERSTMASSEKDLVFTMDAMKRSLAQAESTKEDLWGKVQSLQEELGKATDFKRELEFCANDKSLVTEKLRHMEAQLQSAITENSSLKLNMESTRETFEDLKHSRQQKEIDYEDLDRLVTQEKAELASLKDGRRVMIERISSLESQLGISTMTRDKLEKEFISTKGVFEALAEENAHLKEKMLDLEEKARPMQEFTTKIDELKVEKSDLLQRIRSHEQEIASQEVYKTTMEANLASAKKALGGLKFAQNELKTDLDEMTKKAHGATESEFRARRFEQEKTEAAGQVNTLIARASSLETSKNALESALNANKKALEVEREDRERLEIRFTPLVEKENIVTDLEAKLARTEDDRQEALKRVKALEDRLSETVLEVKTEVKDETQYEALKKENEKLKGQIKSLEKESKKGFENLEYIKKSFAEKEESNEKLKEEVESLNKGSKKGFEGLEYIKKSLATSEETREKLAT
ncbi:MAG: hypothetical protein V3S04_04435, partial [Candidatus Omnitrophota bacterium]